MIQLRGSSTLTSTTTSGFVDTGKVTINITSGLAQVMKMVRTAIEQTCKIDRWVKCTLVFFFLGFLDLLKWQRSHLLLLLLGYLCVHIFSLLLLVDFFSLNLNAIEVLKLGETCDNLMHSLLFKEAQV
jgi:hypothetical protein